MNDVLLWEKAKEFMEEYYPNPQQLANYFEANGWGAQHIIALLRKEDKPHG